MAQLVSFDDAPIRITARGEWLQGDDVLHPKVIELFSKHLVPSLDGRYFIQLGFQRYELVVDDTAYFVTSLDVEKNDRGLIERIGLKISDGQRETLRLDSLMQSDDNVFYCRIIRRELGVACRFPPALYHTLALDIENDGEGYYLGVGGTRCRIVPYRPAPIPMT